MNSIEKFQLFGSLNNYQKANLVANYALTLEDMNERRELIMSFNFPQCVFDYYWNNSHLIKEHSN
jgi:hypothetical protein